jgi:hypothetical protein
VPDTEFVVEEKKKEEIVKKEVTDEFMINEKAYNQQCFPPEVINLFNKTSLFLKLSQSTPESLMDALKILD